MPELPEVETVVRDLRPRLVGRRLVTIEVGRKRLRKRWHPAWNALVLDQQIESVQRRGKWIIVALHGGVCLLVHLGMTGQFLVVPAEQQRESHTHLIFGLDSSGEELRFRDIRRFGSATVWPTRADLERYFLESGLGPEPFDVSRSVWRSTLRGTHRCLKAVLLDQRVVAGVGNIYADESLFQAQLPPTRLADSLTGPEADRLRRAIITVLQRAIDRRGSSIRNYVGGSGLKGQYQEEFRAYGRTGQPCPRCAAPIALLRLAGRATHYCARCQPEE